ncbi:MAG: DUF285 domain-containing protein [Bacteroidales bacterium]|nr:DUF285 domain-containing protein [Bacteroidales bacterium]
MLFFDKYPTTYLEKELLLDAIPRQEISVLIFDYKKNVDTNNLTFTGKYVDNNQKYYKVYFQKIKKDYIYYVLSKKDIIAPEDCTELFSAPSNEVKFFETNLTKLELKNFNTSNTTNMRSMFAGWGKLETLKIDNLDTAKVTDMSFMFNNCCSLKTINLNSFNTNNVTDMSYMFCGCKSLSLLDLYNFDTRKVTDMKCMFSGAENLQEIKIDQEIFAIKEDKTIFENTNNLKGNCGPNNKLTINYSIIDKTLFRKVISLNARLIIFDYIDNVNTKNLKLKKQLVDTEQKFIKIYQKETNYYVLSKYTIYAPKDCSSMFYKFEKLSEIQFNNFNTENVTNMSWMFYDCSSLTSLYLRSFNTENVTDMSQMFNKCISLKSLDLSSFKTGNMTNMSWMFYDCSSLKSLNLSSFNTEKITDMNRLFYKCSSLKSLDLSSFKTKNVSNMSSIFEQCSSLKSLDLSSFKTENVINMSRMFYDCSSLTSLDLSGFNTEKITDMNRMFYNCTSLTSLDLSSFKTKNVFNMSMMFYKCEKLETLKIDRDKFVQNLWLYRDGMFDYTKKLNKSKFENFL